MVETTITGDKCASSYSIRRHINKITWPVHDGSSNAWNNINTNHFLDFDEFCEDTTTQSLKLRKKTIKAPPSGILVHLMDFINMS